ncbi:hypothetical protein [Streptomyces sp. NPDC060031]|uniref:hypothetical protein n=1 Tax=Streptomyces sp. NPDC060031 TaxID=3347043 RepID=UPI0036BB6F18
MAEADFRVNVGLALGGLGLAAWYASGSAVFLAGIVITLAMVRSGIYRQQTANDLLVNVLEAGAVVSIEFTEFDAMVHRSRDLRQDRATHTGTVPAADPSMPVAATSPA